MIRNSVSDLHSVHYKLISYSEHPEQGVKINKNIFPYYFQKVSKRKISLNLGTTCFMLSKKSLTSLTLLSTSVFNIIVTWIVHARAVDPDPVVFLNADPDPGPGPA